MFMTVSDIDRIKTITAKYTHVFWRRVAAVLHQKDTVQNILKQARFSSKSTLTLSNLVTSISAAIVTTAVALATIVKSTVLKTTPLDVGGNPSLVSPDTSGGEVLTWTSQNDERTCDLCSSLDGMQWSSDDPDLLMPPDDSHSNCRCRLDTNISA